MCSVADIEQVGEEKSTKPRQQEKASKNGDCMKCAKTGVVLVRNGDPFCKACFLDYIVHKFRATIGKARVVRQGERVLLAISGGSSSCAMLDLVKRGLSKEAPKKLRFQPGVVHVDEGELLGRTFEEREAIKETIKSMADAADFPFHAVSLEELFLESYNLEGISEKIPNDKSPLIELFSKVETITAKEDLLRHLYRWQLQKTTKEHGYDRVMVGDCSTTLSIRILSDVAQGRGAQLPFNIGFQDDRVEISILRPMREFTKKEIEFYNNFNKVSSFSIPSFSTMESPHVSINRLTQEFILGLQAAFPSTVNTVLRTGDKLSSHSSGGHQESCSICLAPLESDLSLVATELSKSYGGGCSNNSENNDSCGKEGDGGDSSDNGHTSVRCAKEECGDDHSNVGGSNDKCAKEGGSDDDCCSVGNGSKYASWAMHGDVSHNVDQPSIHSANTLCYGCRLTYNDIKSKSCLLPGFMTDNAVKTTQRTMMREQIKEYLLDE